MTTVYKIALVATVPVAPAVAPEPLQQAIADNPVVYAAIAIAAAMFGGFAVQYRAWINGKVSIAQASSELIFSVIAGLVAWWIAQKANRDWSDLVVGALLMGAAGRPFIIVVQKTATAGATVWLARLLGVPSEALNANQNQACDSGQRADRHSRTRGHSSGAGEDQRMAGEDDQ